MLLSKSELLNRLMLNGFQVFQCDEAENIITEHIDQRNHFNLLNIFKHENNFIATKVRTIRSQNWHAEKQ